MDDRNLDENQLVSDTSCNIVLLYTYNFPKRLQKMIDDDGLTLSVGDTKYPI